MQPLDSLCQINRSHAMKPAHSLFTPARSGPVAQASCWFRRQFGVQGRRGACGLVNTSLALGEYGKNIDPGKVPQEYTSALSCKSCGTMRFVTLLSIPRRLGVKSSLSEVTCMRQSCAYYCLGWNSEVGLNYVSASIEYRDIETTRHTTARW